MTALLGARIQRRICRHATNYLEALLVRFEYPFLLGSNDDASGSLTAGELGLLPFSQGDADKEGVSHRFFAISVCRRRKMKRKNDPTAADVAAFMLQQLREQTYLYQEVVVYQIQEQFGDDFVYINQNGNLAIGKDVLAQFRKLTGDDVVWERSERLWRQRMPDYDQPGRRQD